MTKAFDLASAQPPAFPGDFRVVRSAVLNRTSLEANNNKFYVLEIHEAGGRYRLFTHYGRVGTDGIKEGRFADSLDAVMGEYGRILREKTSPRKGYVPIEVEKSAVGSNSLRAVTEQAFKQTRGEKQSRLHADVAGFVEHIYDETKAELVRRIETPLGSLSKAQIEKGADALRAIRFAIARDHQDKIVPLTSQYYSLIPHRLGRWTHADDVAINSIEKADGEEELLQLMRDVYHVQGELEAEVDHKYRALGAHLDVVERDSPDYRRVEKKILATQSSRHGFKLKVNKLFRACLPDERAQFVREGQPVGNVRELFHGTKNSNMVGILTRGLLIAPKNVPVSGYMFGKGIYFADQSTKSAQYALNYVNNARRPCGYLFLANVALGRVKKEIIPKYREEAPDRHHSVQGCKGLHLIHNEFIIYKTAQCTLRYIAEIEQAQEANPMNTQIIPIVEQAVVERMRAKASFTALDISNALKADRCPVKHSEVAGVTRDIYASGAMGFYDFDRRLIDVVTDGGAKKAQAFLYLHHETREREYTARSRTSLPLVPPDQARDLSEGVPVGVAALLPHPRLTRLPCSRSLRQRLRRDGALAIPRALVALLGWNVGTPLALDTAPGALRLSPTAHGGPARVWDGQRIRLCRRKLSMAALTAGCVTMGIDGDGLKITAE